MNIKLLSNNKKIILRLSLVVERSRNISNQKILDTNYTNKQELNICFLKRSFLFSIFEVVWNNRGLFHTNKLRLFSKRNQTGIMISGGFSSI